MKRLVFIALVLLSACSPAPATIQIQTANTALSAAPTAGQNAVANPGEIAAVEIPVVAAAISASPPVTETIGQPPATPATSASRPQLGLTLGDFGRKRERMTTLQRRRFDSQALGNSVDWTAVVQDVLVDGEILIVQMNPALVVVSLKGVPEKIALTLSKGQSIHFTGIISDIRDTGSVVVEDVQLLP